MLFNLTVQHVLSLLPIRTRGARISQRRIVRLCSFRVFSWFPRACLFVERLPLRLTPSGLELVEEQSEKLGWAGRARHEENHKS